MKNFTDAELTSQLADLIRKNADLGGEWNFMMTGGMSAEMQLANEEEIQGIRELLTQRAEYRAACANSKMAPAAFKAAVEARVNAWCKERGEQFRGPKLYTAIAKKIGGIICDCCMVHRGDRHLRHCDKRGNF